MRPLIEHWYSPRAPFWLLPLSFLFRSLAAVRRLAFRTGLLRSTALPVPVIVVGNITVGGTGKTPLVVWLVKQLQQAGYRPGIITRGYGGEARHWPQQVTAGSDPRLVGDEPVLLAQRCGCPVAAAPDRVAAARLLLGRGCDVVISDDGLQHYRLRRDIEIVVIDGARRFGNGHCLPAGPLREPVSRLRRADFVVVNGAPHSGEHGMRLVPETCHSLMEAGRVLPLEALHGQRVHAVAGIGNPARFFDLLRGHGLIVEEHPFPDHHGFSRDDLVFADELPLLMTEKDAVKCRGFANERMWYLPVAAQLDGTFHTRLMDRLNGLMKKG